MRVIRFLALLVVTYAAAFFLGPARAEPIAASALGSQLSVSTEAGLVQDVYWRRHYWHRHYYHRAYWHRPYYHHYGWRRHYWHRRYWHRHYWHRHYWHHRHWRRW